MRTNNNFAAEITAPTAVSGSVSLKKQVVYAALTPPRRFGIHSKSMTQYAKPYIQMLSRSGELTVRIRGDCMTPALCSGSRVAVINRRRYRIGDVIVHWNGLAGIGAHRLLGYWRFRGQGFAVTCGDRDPDSLRVINADRIIGRAACSEGGEPLIVRPSQRARALLAFGRWLILSTGARLWRLSARIS